MSGLMKSNAPTLKVTNNMVASNLPAHKRVVPPLEAMSVIGEIYSFAKKLQAGSDTSPQSSCNRGRTGDDS